MPSQWNKEEVNVYVFFELTCTCFIFWTNHFTFTGRVGPRKERQVGLLVVAKVMHLLVHPKGRRFKCKKIQGIIVLDLWKYQKAQVKLALVPELLQEGEFLCTQHWVRTWNTIHFIKHVCGYFSSCTEPLNFPIVFSQAGEGASNAITTPRRRLGLKKKLTPKKRKKIYVWIFLEQRLETFVLF